MYIFTYVYVDHFNGVYTIWIQGTCYYSLNEGKESQQRHNTFSYQSNSIFVQVKNIGKQNVYNDNRKLFTQNTIDRKKKRSSNIKTNVKWNLVAQLNTKDETSVTSHTQPIGYTFDEIY
jgi:hypothetical protein